MDFKGTFPKILIVLAVAALAAFSSFSAKKEHEEDLASQKLLEEKQAEEKIYLTGKFEPAGREDFAHVPEEYSIGRNGMYLRKEALDAFLVMREAAQADGINLKIASATRNFDYQKNIWESKWTGFTLVDGKKLSQSVPDGLERFKKILEWSAAPGTSRHHWGTDVDINAAVPDYFNFGQGKREYEWLAANASRFGFCQPYNAKNGSHPTGYNEEKWHWSYLPIAQDLTQEYADLVKNEDINGFLGDEYVSQTNLIGGYMLGINPECI